MSYDYCDYETPKFYHEAFPKARKKHKCCECTAPIVPGETYLHVGVKWDDTPETFHQHMLCRQLCMLMNEDDGCCGFGEMKNQWSELDYHLEKHTEARKLYAAIIRRERAALRESR